MERPGRHLSRPLYEGLPWIYMASGVLALAGSYWLAAHAALSLGHAPGDQVVNAPEEIGIVNPRNKLLAAGCGASEPKPNKTK